MGSNQVTEDGCSRMIAVSKNFKVYSENEKGKVDTNGLRKSVQASKGSTRTSTGNLKIKGSTIIMEKYKGKCESSENSKVQRKALADVSNVSAKVSKNSMVYGTKQIMGRNEGSVISQRVSVGPGSRALNVSLRKSIMRTEREYGQALTSKIGTKDVKVGLDDQRTKSGNAKAVTERKSLQALKRMSEVGNPSVEENVTRKEKVREVSGAQIGSFASVNTKVNKKVMAGTSNAKSNIWRNQASDGFLVASSAQINVGTRPLQRKSIKPFVETRIRASSAKRTIKSMHSSGQEKSSISAILSKRKESVSLVVSSEAAQGQTSANKNNDQNTGSSDVIATRKSHRRRSYTSLLMARSKFLEEHGEVTQQENLANIDDECNQLEVAEYVDDIYQYYWVAEAQNPPCTNYMSIQTELTPSIRSILINWLIEVHFKFDLMQETLYLTVTLLDRYLSQVQIKKNEMQLVGLTALLLASKYEDFWHPRVKDLISISAESYTRDQMLRMEKLILKKLKFRLNTPTPYVFMLRFLKAAQSNKKLEHLAFYLVDLCLVEYEALKFKPSLLCASALYLARCTLQMTPAWTPLLEKHARYHVVQMRECAEMILNFQKAARSGRLKVTYDKYMNSDLGKVAAIRPLDSLRL